MRRGASFLILFCVMVMTPGLHAGVVPAGFSACPTAERYSNNLANIRLDRVLSADSGGDSGLYVQLETSSEWVPSRDRPLLRQLPPLPDSAVLFLYALGSLGAWQAGRSARKIHFDTMPEWYYSGGPGQVNQARAWNPAVDMPGLNVLSTVEFPRRIGVYARFERVSNRYERYSQIPIIPRGPPK